MSGKLIKKLLVEPTSAYRPDIDGLRAIAVLSVVLFHANIFPFSSGFVGVDIFFVISGYLIGGIIIREILNNSFSFNKFYARRAKRILPALFVVITVTCILGWFLLDAAELRSVGATATTALLAVSNISFWHYQDYFAVDSKLSPLLMTWTLGVEEQFYFLFPLLIIVLMKFARKNMIFILAGIALSSFAFSMWATWSHPATAYYLLPSRVWELSAGLLLAVWENMRRALSLKTFALIESKTFCEMLGSFGIILIGISTFCFDENTPFPGVLALLPVVGSVALIWSQKSSINRLLLSARPSVFIGKISYSWYLWHWPLLSYLRILFLNRAPSSAVIVIVILSLIIAIFSWLFIEQPFRIARLNSKIVLKCYALALIIFLIIPVSIKIMNGIPQRLTDETKNIEKIIAAGRGDCIAGFDVSTPDTSSRCAKQIYGRPTIALLGDSHAAALGFGLRERADKENFGYMIFTKSACGPLLGITTWERVQPRLAAACGAFMQDALKIIAIDKDVRIVFVAGHWLPSRLNVNEAYYVGYPGFRIGSQTDLLYEGLERTIAELTKYGKTVIVMGDVPEWEYDLRLVALADSIPVRRKASRFLWKFFDKKFPKSGTSNLIVPRDKATVKTIKSLTQNLGVQYIDLYSRFCDGDKCRFMQNDSLLFVDTAHLSNMGSTYALQNIEINLND